MIELINKGMYLVDGRPVESADVPAEEGVVVSLKPGSRPSLTVSFRLTTTPATLQSSR